MVCFAPVRRRTRRHLACMILGSIRFPRVGSGAAFFPAFPGRGFRAPVPIRCRCRRRTGRGDGLRMNGQRAACRRGNGPVQKNLRGIEGDCRYRIKYLRRIIFMRKPCGRGLQTKCWGRFRPAPTWIVPFLVCLPGSRHCSGAVQPCVL